MKRRIMVAVGATLLLTAGCANGDPGSDDAGGISVPTPTVLPQKLTKPGAAPDLEPQDSPADDAPFSEQLKYELEVRTLKMAAAEGETTATCPSDLEASKGTTADCTTTFEGLEVQWTVKIGDNAAWSDNYVQYEATPSTGILTKDGVVRLLFGNYSDTDYVLCNDIPDAVLAPLNVHSPYECEVVSQGDEPTGYAKKVRATEAGPRAA
ncbi:MAG TPA: hypothetical protein VFY14_19200 [Streptomyces sp.]|nr:hypothetical protein [Streptomyces sp.]